ncbi:MAG: pyruvate, phosphate dikinase [Firmicutes bacterium]|nr:pyruvate, phosphate dikinase [Bacillota bacterium]
MQKLVYSFNEGSKEKVSLLGGKGANLSEMIRNGLRVPFGFTVTTQACKRYYAEGKILSQELISEIEDQMKVLENVVGKTFGDRENPLLVSVRSGAEIHVPGLMDTILDLGLNDETACGLADLTGNPRFAYDSYRRFIQMYGELVLDIPKSCFDNIFDEQKAAAGVKRGVELSAESLQELVTAYKAVVKAYTGKPFPQDPKEQLLQAVEAAFRSWDCAESNLYREVNGISDDLGTAVSVQAMVFGNMGDTSGAGVACTRNPYSGEPELVGEFLVNAQGEDLASGNYQAKSIAEMAETLPDVYRDLTRIATALEKHYKDMQYVEFTIENGKLYVLQTSDAKRNGHAAVRVAYDMVQEGIISKKTAVERMDVSQMKNLLHPLSEELEAVLSWADEIRSLKVRANVKSLSEVQDALNFGAEGIGLCRTEELLQDEKLAPLIRQMFTTKDTARRRGAMHALLMYQKADFKRMYQVMEDKPVTIRLMDPPPQTYFSEEDVNPLLGHRGCRLAILYPEIAEMQTQAIVEAALEVKKEKNVEIVPEIMIPMVGSVSELAAVKQVVVDTIEVCKAKYHMDIDYFVGTMIEVPRAALTAGEIAKEAEFFSFGTNDLTQMTYGFSKEDTENLIQDYMEKGIFEDDPFQTIDPKGVGFLMENAVKMGKQTRPTLRLGICGEHGGDPRSIAFCDKIGLHYVSCSPEKVPVARIAAAQAVLQKEK